MYLLTAPTVEPVTLAEAKLAARISSTAFDTMIPGHITAARELAEQLTGRQIMAQTWRVDLTDWPATTDVLAICQATAAAVQYWDGSAWATLSGVGYMFAPVGYGTALAPAAGASWPALGARPVGARVHIDLTAGEPTAATVEESIKLFIKGCVAFWVDNPQAAGGAGSAGQSAPTYLAHLLDRAKIYA